jgi:ribosomal protein L34E
MEKQYKYFCECCILQTNAPSLWLKHLSSQKHIRNGKPKTHKCEECDYECKSLWNLKLHKLSQHLSKEERSKSKYYCNTCDKVFFSQIYHDSHMKGIKHKNLFLLEEYNNNLNSVK